MTDELCNARCVKARGQVSSPLSPLGALVFGETATLIVVAALPTPSLRLPFTKTRLTNLPLTASFTAPSTHTRSYVFHSPLPLQRFSMDLLRLPRGLSGTAVRPFAPSNSPCTCAMGGRLPSPWRRRLTQSRAELHSDFSMGVGGVVSTRATQGTKPKRSRTPVNTRIPS